MKLPADVQASLKACIEHTVHNTGMCLVLALSYSSRWEITEAARQIAAQVKAGEISPEQITDEYISSHLSTNFMPDPDLLIRTGGRNPVKQLYVMAMCLFGTFIFVISFGRILTTKNSIKLSANINKENAGSAKPVNKSANIIRNIKL